jgi:hypothetical protein
MSITTDLDAWWTAKTAYDDSNEAKAEFQRIMGEIDRSLDELAAMNAAGKFNQLPATVKAEFTAAWIALDTVRDTLKADAGFMEALNWRP